MREAKLNNQRGQATNLVRGPPLTKQIPGRVAITAKLNYSAAGEMTSICAKLNRTATHRMREAKLNTADPQTSVPVPVKTTPLDSPLLNLGLLKEMTRAKLNNNQRGQATNMVRGPPFTK